MIKQTKQKKQKPIEYLTREEENVLYWVGLLALPLGIISAYIMIYLIMPIIPDGECIFWTIFGVYCPGCGGTRAVIAFVHGDFLVSLWYHPLILYVAIIYALYIVTHTLEKIHFPLVKGMRFRVTYLYGTLVIIAINCVVKNILKFAFGIVM